MTKGLIAVLRFNIENQGNHWKKGSYKQVAVSREKAMSYFLFNADL